jgi:hypothetical protein
MSRRFAPVVGGFAYLTAMIWLEKWTAVIVCGILALIILFLRLGFRQSLRGVRGTHQVQTWVEITYLLAGTLSLVVGWGILGNKWLGFIPTAFMAWGDTAAGLVRDTISPNRSPIVVSMSAIFIVCVGAAAVFFRPLWIGVVGGIVATLAERFRPGILGFWDDNVYIVAISLVVMAVLLRVFV